MRGILFGRGLFRRSVRPRTPATGRARWPVAAAEGLEPRRLLTAYVVDTTLDDGSAFLAAVVRGQGLSANALQQMTSGHIVIDCETQCPSLQEKRTDRWKSLGLG